MRRESFEVLLLTGLLGLGGCAVGPAYERPAVALPAQYRYGDPAANLQATDAAWWQSFGDPVLDGLVKEALANNRDLESAAGRVEQFYGTLRTTRSAFYPKVGAEVNGSRTRASERTSSVAPPVNPYNAVSADLFASWEIDLFGRIRYQSEAARADLLASEEARLGVVLSVVAAVVNGYVTLRDLDRELEVSRDTLTSRTAALDLFERRFKGGVVSELELNQARSEYATALRSVPDKEQLIAQQEHALSVLLGRNPGPIERGRAIDELAAPAVPSGLPSVLLERRPDLRQAEQAMIAANARIGAARALYYPDISLTGLFGAASTSLSQLWTGPARIWTFAGAVTMPIFSGGSIAGQVQSAEGGRREAQANYQKAIQSAFQDTENALIGVRKSGESLDAQKLEVSSLRTYARVARQRYEGGYTSYLEVLDAERSLFASEISLAQSHAAALGQHIALFKALGGGWVALADQGTPQPSVRVGETPPAWP
jgi:multidrug efflux system outer membrane protein